MTIRATAQVVPLLAVILLTSCTQNPGVEATQSTTPSSTASAPSSTVLGTSAPSGSSAASASPTDVQPDYAFPVRAKSPRFGRAHHDYPATDIFAPCGSEVIAVTAGVVSEISRKDRWTARVNDGATRGGLSVTIIGTDGVRYYGSHLKSIETQIAPGYRVRAAERLGRVGRTGSAQATPCHLHFGISPPCAKGDWWNRRGVLSPYPFLTSWKNSGRHSPVKAVAAWRAEYGCSKKAPK